VEKYSFRISTIYIERWMSGKKNQDEKFAYYATEDRLTDCGKIETQFMRHVLPSFLFSPQFHQNNI